MAVLRTQFLASPSFAIRWASTALTADRCGAREAERTLAFVAVEQLGAVEVDWNAVHWDGGERQCEL
ncbi:MAG: hypothetical protein ACREPW_09675 [Candidatus Binataceae bacterium]